MFEIELVELSKIESLRFIHLFVCGVGALFLIFIWKRTVFLDQTNKSEIGLLLFAGAFLMWVFMDAYRFTGLMKPGESSLIIKTFSAYNNAFFIAALPFFEKSFNFFQKTLRVFKSKTKWALVVLASNIILVMIYALVWKNEKDSGVVVHYIDLFYSILTYILLGYAVCSRTYSSRVLRNSTFYIGVILSLALILIQLSFSPLFKIGNYDLVSASALICHTTLVILLISIGYEWLLEVRTSIVSEQNRTQEKIEYYLKENRKLELELNDLKLKISNEHSISSLTDRELEVLKHIKHSYTEIGEKLFISRDTVITHKKNIEGKLGISGKKNLEEFAAERGLVDGI